MWSERLAPAYFSKGPGIAFAIRASTAVFGANEFGVRFFTPLLAAGTSLLLFYFARRLFNARAGLWVVIALNVTPIFNIGAFVMTIDALSIFFWLAAMFTFWLALEKSPQFSWYWPLAGLLIGLGFLSKYTNALELVSIVLVLALAPRLRHEFKVLFLMWFGLPVFLFYLFLSLNKAAAPNWDGLAFLGFGLLAIYYWWEHLETSSLLRLGAAIAILVGLTMSAVALDTDLLRVVGYNLQRSDPSNRMRGWKSATSALETIRNDLETKLGEKLFLIADARDRASEISFYLRRTG